MNLTNLRLNTRGSNVWFCLHVIEIKTTLFSASGVVMKEVQGGYLGCWSYSFSWLRYWFHRCAWLWKFTLSSSIIHLKKVSFFQSSSLCWLLFGLEALSTCEQASHRSLSSITEATLASLPFYDSLRRGHSSGSHCPINYFELMPMFLCLFCVFIHLLIFIYLLLVAVRLKLRVSHLLGKCSITWATPSLFVFFWVFLL
jgi:hypothetical protein